MERTRGMRPSSASHCSSKVRPSRLAANMPVSSTTRMTRTKRKPGRSIPIRDCDDKKPGTKPSRVAISRPSTQRVMASGTQISSPVMKYFLMTRIRRGPRGAQDDAVEAGVDGAATGAALSLLAGTSALTGASALAALSAAGLALSDLAPAWLPCPLRKSVTYQPEPLSWKPAAVTCLVKVPCPHSGPTERTRDVQGKGGSVRVDLG